MKIECYECPNKVVFFIASSLGDSFFCKEHDPFIEGGVNINRVASRENDMNKVKIKIQMEKDVAILLTLSKRDADNILSFVKERGFRNVFIPVGNSIINGDKVLYVRIMKEIENGKDEER